MGFVPSSPRVRRRLFRLGIVLGIAGIVAAIVALVPDPKPQNPAPAKNAPPAQVAKQSTYVSPADRRAINTTLDRFLPAALDRTAPATAWRLAGPGLTGGSTLRQWRHGTSPIPYYPARGKTFHGWRTIDSGPGYVDFNILVHPKHGSQTSSWVFSGEMVKHDGRWLVNGLYTIATMARPTKSGRHEVGPADFGAGAAQSSSQAGPPQTGSSSLGTKWLLVAGGVIILAVLFPVGLAVGSLVKSRRGRRLYARTPRESLPPLPQTFQRASEPVGSGGRGGPRH